ncbi:MAG: PAS sensor protein [Calothrix sp. SM1_5_4]|nr:PAS sensor protein [Calothrix sp. SM1_5_4]
MIRSLSQRVLRLIDRTLELAGLERPSPHPAEVNMEGVFELALRNLRVLIQQNRARVAADDLPAVNGEEGQVLRLMQNLLANALRFRKPDIDPEIQVGVEDDGDRWLFSVRDNGAGMDPRLSARVFNLYSRGEGVDGGVGLAVCKRIVEANGGEIWFNTIPGEGTTFFFTWPKRAEPSVQSKPAFSISPESTL